MFRQTLFQALGGTVPVDVVHPESFVGCRV